MKPLQRLAFVSAAIAALFVSLPFGARADSGAPSQTDIEFFKQESYRGSNKSEAEKDWEDLLFESAKAGETPKQTITLFAARINTDEASAETIASAIIEIVRWDKFCPDKRNDAGYDCRFEHGAPAYNKFLAAQNVDATGELAFVIGKNVGSAAA